MFFVSGKCNIMLLVIHICIYMYVYMWGVHVFSFSLSLMYYLKKSSCNILFLCIKFDLDIFLNGILMCVYIEEICGPNTWKLQYHVAV